MAFGYTYTLPTITGSHTDLPVVLKNADFPSASIGSGVDAIDNGGGNLRAYTDSTKGIQLPIDVVKFVTGVSPSVVVWVKVPTAATSNTIYLEADSVSSTQPAIGAAFGRNAVWSGYEAVLHLRESGNGTAGEFVDSTGNGHDGQLTTGSSISTTSSSHPFGDVWPDFTQDHVITLANSTNLIDNTAFSMSVYCNVDFSINSVGLFGNRNNADDTNWAGFQASERLFTKGSTVENLADNGARPTLTTLLVTGTQDTSALRLYSDSTNIASDTTITSGESISSTQNFRIGTYFDNSFARRLNGRVCEARVRRSVLSGDWIATENDNQSSIGAWGTVGAWKEATPSAFQAAWAHYRNIIIQGNQA